MCREIMWILFRLLASIPGELAILAGSLLQLLMNVLEYVTASIGQGR